MQLSKFLLKQKMTLIKTISQLKSVNKSSPCIVPAFIRFAPHFSTSEKAKDQEAKQEQKQTDKNEEETTEKDKDQPKEEAKKEEEGEKKQEQKKEETPEQLLEKKNKTLQEKLKKREEEIEELNKKLDLSINKYKYQLAENDNTVKRYKEEVKKAGEFSISKFAKDLIEVRDSLQLAMNHTDKIDIDKEETDKIKSEFKNLWNGVKMTSNVFDKTMKRFNVEEFNPIGEKFNPLLHEAVAMIDDPSKEPGTVWQVMSTGWKIGDRILRASRVLWVKKRESN